MRDLDVVLRAGDTHEPVVFLLASGPAVGPGSSLCGVTSAASARRWQESGRLSPAVPLPNRALQLTGHRWAFSGGVAFGIGAG